MKFQEMNYADFTSAFKELPNQLLIDVREDHENEDFNIGGVNIPMGEILGRTNELKDFDEIFLYCKSGKRSKTVAYHLSSCLDNKAIISLEGGISEYQNNG